MTSAVRVVVLLVAVVVGLCAPVSAEWFDTPDFTDHEIPSVESPSADSTWWEYIDVLVLLAALSVSSYFVLVNRWRRGILGVTIFSLAYFGFFRYGCVCSIGSIQNVALAICDSSYAIPTTIVAFFVLPLVFTLFFGRTFCASVCPLGAVQELITIRSVKVPKAIDHALGLVPYFYLGAAVIFAGTGAAFVICRYDPFVAMFRLGGDVNMLVFGGCVLLIGFFVGRPYCRYLCPYGGVLALLSKVSWRHAKITPTDCIQCRLCEEACPYGAISEPTVDQPQDRRLFGRRRLTWVLLAAPVLVGAFAVMGTLLSGPMARVHPDVHLAESLQWEEARQSAILEIAPEQRSDQQEAFLAQLTAEQGTTDATQDFRERNASLAQQYELAAEWQGRFRWLGGWFGAWVGLVIGVKLINLCIRRRSPDYVTDRASCVSCGRCYWYCPNEQLRLGLIEDVSEMVDAAVLERSAAKAQK